MRKKRITLFHPLLVFILAQVAWLSLVGLWIYWYVSNYIILKQVGERLAPQLISTRTHIGALISGLVLLICVLVGMYFVFIYLARQININRLYDSFIANFTHELKSPLASLQLYLETFRKRKVPEEKRKAFLDMMMKDIQRLKDLIDSILNISQIEQKKMAYQFRIHTADVLVKELVNRSREQFNLPREAITVSGSAPCRWKADREAMTLVFNNLIDNAMKYTPGEFTLTIQMMCTGKQFILKFVDRGIGIKTEDQKHIFEKFFRITNSHVPNIRGTGLGLYLVREIVKDHGGSISVHSAGLNKGSTFILEFPIYEKEHKMGFDQLLPINKKRGKNNEPTSR